MNGKTGRASTTTGSQWPPRLTRGELQRLTPMKEPPVANGRPMFPLVGGRVAIVPRMKYWV